VWKATVDGKQLRFHLAGINNQNFIMRDEETGSFWQQVSGEAVSGPLKGKKLEPILYDDVSFAVWTRENPNGRVLVPDDSAPWKQFSENWEEETGKYPSIVKLEGEQPFEPRTIILGLKVNGRSKAYSLEKVRASAPIVDELDGVPVLLLVADDGRSVRAFDRTVDGKVLEFFATKDGEKSRIVDSESQSVWDFAGTAVDGPLAGRRLRQLQLLEDYWFDWKSYNPETEVAVQ
jgi:hypothetical protein